MSGFSTKTHKNGFTLLEVVVTMAIVMILIALGFESGLRSFELLAKVQRNRSLQEFKADLKSCLNDPVSVKYSLYHPANSEFVKCLQLDESCEGVQPQPFIAFKYISATEANPPALIPCTDFNPADLTSGISERGEACNTPGEQGCNFQYQLTWQPVCNPGECVNPRNIKFETTLVDLIEDQRTGNPINVGAYGFSLVKNPFAGDRLEVHEKHGPAIQLNSPTNCQPNQWHTRPFNSVEDNSGSRVMDFRNSRLFVFPGTYKCRYRLPSYKGNKTQARIVRVPGANGGNVLETLNTSLNAYSPLTLNQAHNWKSEPVEGVGVFDIWEPMWIEVQQWIETCTATGGAEMGRAPADATITQRTWASLVCETI